MGDCETKQTNRALRGLPAKFLRHVGQLLGLAVLAGASHASHAAAFAVAGETIYDLFNVNGEITSSVTNTFAVSVQGDQWRIVTCPAGRSNRVDCARDFECIRTLVSEYRITKTNAYWANSVTIDQMEAPSLDHPTLQALWLAYCSKGYLDRSTNGMIRPVWMQDDPTLSSKGYRTKAMWTNDHYEPGLLQSATFLNDGLYRGYDREAQKPFEIGLPPPYDAGYTSAVYYVTALTNAGDLSLPAEFVITTFRVPLGKSVKPHIPRDTLMGIVTSATTIASEQVFRPEYVGNASIHDFRFSQKYPRDLLPGGFATYKARDNHWPEGQELDAAVYKYTRRFIPHDVRKPTTGNKRRWPVVLVLICSMTVPAVFFLVKKVAASRRP